MMSDMSYEENKFMSCILVLGEWFASLCLFSCLDGTPELTKWTERMFEDPAVKATMHTVDTYKAFWKTYIDGKPNYDYGL